MKFYFPDSQDLVSPTYDFLHDEYSPLRVRQRDDKYAHEVLSLPAYNGILVSKAIVDGSIRGVGKYSMPQRQRLYRLGVHDFFRLPDDVETMGDCGAFNYVNEPEPPYTVDEVLDFYEHCGFQAGVSVDHIILGYQRPGLVSDGSTGLDRSKKNISSLCRGISCQLHVRENPTSNLSGLRRVGILKATPIASRNCRKWDTRGSRWGEWFH